MRNRPISPITKCIFVQSHLSKHGSVTEIRSFTFYSQFILKHTTESKCKEYVKYIKNKIKHFFIKSSSWFSGDFLLTQDLFLLVSSFLFSLNTAHVFFSVTFAIVNIRRSAKYIYIFCAAVAVANRCVCVCLCHRQF